MRGKMRDKYRDFTNNSDNLLIIMHNEGNSLSFIVNILGRDIDTVKERLKMLFETGKARAIHKNLMLHRGLYASRMAKKKFPEYRFEGAMI